MVSAKSLFLKKKKERNVNVSQRPFFCDTISTVVVLSGEKAVV